MELNKIFNCDCLELMKTLPDKCIDLCLTDPPYGINADKGVGGGIMAGRKYKGGWDSTRPSIDVFNEIQRISKNIIIFGGNFFTDLLPVGRHWIVWDKVGEINFNNPYSGAELCWTNISKNTVKKYVYIQAGFISSSKDKRVHPTQKPTELSDLILKDYAKESDIIFDPFAGSGTFLVSAQNLGFKYIGCELDKDYFEIAEKRLGFIKQRLF